MSRAFSPEKPPRPATPADLAAITAIYNHYVAHTTVTFEEEPVVQADMAARLDAVVSAGWPWLVVEEAGAIAGYCYAAPWKARSGYRFSAEITVYLDPARTARGLGTVLYEQLFTLLRSKGVHAAMGGIALPNDASVALHEKLGMRKVAHFEQVGFKLGRWIDVGYWQMLLDRPPR